MKKMQSPDLNEISRDPGFQDAVQPTQKDIKVIGVGGGGVNAASRIYEQLKDSVSYAIINTDSASLRASDVPIKLCIGPGRGAGDNPDKARELAHECEEKIGALLDDGTQLVFITASMGGGTGTGAAPVVAKVAHEKGILTIGVVTIPFHFEGRLKISKALKGAELMSQYVDALIMIDNQKLIECYPDDDMTDNFAKADETLAQAVTSISNLINTVGYWNIDLNDVNTTLRQSHGAIISTGTGSGKNRVTQAINNALESPLVKNRDVYNSSKLLITIFASSKAGHGLNAAEVKEIEDFKNHFKNEPSQKTGWYFDDSLDDDVKFTILAAGFSIDFDNELEQPKYIILKPDELDDDNAIEIIERTPAFKRDPDKKKAIEEKRLQRQNNARKTGATTATNSKPSTPATIDFGAGD